MPNPVLERLVTERENTHNQVNEMLDAVANEERDPSEAERDLLARHRARLDSLEPQIIQLVEYEERRAASRDAHAVLTRPAPEARNDGTIVPTAPAPTDEVAYRSFAHYTRDWLVDKFDVIAARAGMGVREEARERLTRAVAQTTTTQIPGLLPPQWLSDLIGTIDKSRPIVSVARKVPLNMGKIVYPTITTRPVVGKQTAEKTELPSGPMGVSMTERTADVYGGVGNLSWQAINWSTPDALSLFVDLLAEDYAKKTEAATAELVQNVAGTPIVVGAAGDLAAWMTALVAARTAVYKNSGRRPNAVAMDVDSAAQLMSLVATASPVFVSAGSLNLSTGEGNVAGFTVVISRGFDAKTVVVGDYSALLVAETAGAPVDLRAVEPSIAGMEVGIVGGFLPVIVEATAFAKITPPVGTFEASATKEGGK